MKVAQYFSFGNPLEVLELVDIKIDDINDNEVRIALEAASINPADLLAIHGLYPIRPSLPAIPGSEGVGRIVEVGSKITNVRPGDRVFLPFKVGLGTWREEMIITGEDLFALPENADPLQLAMSSVNPPSAYFMLTKFVSLNKGDWVIQNAANSAVGRYVIAFAKLMGIKTINIVRRESIVDDLLESGGDIVLVDGPDLAKRVSKATKKTSIKLALDGVAGDATHRLSQCLAFEGTVVNYGAMSMKKCELGASQTIFKQIKLTGLWLQKWTQTAPVSEVKSLYQKTNEALINGSVKVKIDTVYPFQKLNEAIRHAMKEQRNGKILITGPAFTRNI
ncbi:MAG: Quinone oxidoreductase 1 [Candidatus Heimdallarchaeota archaeon LC_3]|nr:MAG: Quinone oxidoreductase 1 [Candidatus Heimdallarchaeota archaeon LC_3]